MPFDEPGCVVDLPKDEQRLTELLDGVEGAHPEQVPFQGADKALGAAVPLDNRTKAGELAMFRKASSCYLKKGHVQVSAALQLDC